MDDTELYKNKAWMLQKYETEELTTRKMSVLANCCPATICDWLHILGIHIRTYSEANTGNRHSEETKQKIGDTNRGIYVGEKNHNYGKPLSDETKRKIGDAKRGTHHSTEARKKMSEARRGEKNANWRGGISLGPYCAKFNRSKKEEIRNEHNRKCYVCGAEENGKKHCVHHTDYNKMQGCTTENWNLVPLCQSCHPKTNFNRWYWFNLLYNHWAMNTEINFDVGGRAWTMQN